MIKKVYKLMLSAIVFSWVAFSCTEEANNGKTPDKFSGEEKEIIFSINVPAVTDATSQLRSIDASQENTIRTIDLIAFRTDNTGSYFDYYYPGTLADDNTPGASTQKCVVKVRLASYTQDLVIITNAGTLVSDLVAKTAPNTSKDAFLAGLEYALPKAGDSWNAVSASNFAALPMWGETTATINNNTTQLSASLLRMLAKIDVRLDPDSVQSKSLKFSLKSVYVYNTLTNGRIAPGSTVFDKTANKVTAPSLPAVPGKFLGPLLYNKSTDFSPPGKTGEAMIGAIYTFETEAPDSADALSRLAATCVVVGGVYDTDTDTTYYRVDFHHNGIFQDILRNHRYLVNIISVEGSGYKTPDEAYRSVGMNMIVNVLIWSDDDMNDVVFNGQWHLGVSNNNVIIAKNDTINNDLSVITDYNPLGSSTSGWYVESITDSATQVSPAPWLQVIPDHGAPNELKNVQIKTDSTTVPRTATIVFVAGRLRYPVTVRQTLTERPTIKINYVTINGVTTIVGAEVIPSELDFTFTVPGGTASPPFHGIQVTVTPTTIPITMYRTDVQGVAYAPFTIAPDAGVITTSNDGTHIMTVTPPKVTVDDIINGSYLREELWVMTATNGPYTITKTLLLKHQYVP